MSVSTNSAISGVGNLSYSTASGNITGPDGQPINDGKLKSLNIAIAGNSITGQSGGGPLPAIQLLSNPQTWAPSTSVALTKANVAEYTNLSNGIANIKWICTTAGSTGTLEPDWPLAAAIGTTLQDGSVTWTATALGSTEYWTWSDMGWWPLAQALSGQRLTEYIVTSKSGRRSDEILPYITQRIRMDQNIGIVYFANMFENDVVQLSSNLTQIQTNWLAVLAEADACRAIGKRVIMNTVLPSGNIDASSTFTGYVSAGGTRAWNWLNAQIRSYARARPDVILVDVSHLYTDPNPANPVWPENVINYVSANGNVKKTDGVHPLGAARWLLANQLSPIIRANFPERTLFTIAGDSNSNDVNGGNGGTGGSAGANASGTIAALMAVNAYANSGATTGVCSLVARSDTGGNWQQVVYTCVGSADKISYEWAAGKSTFVAPGAAAQAFVEYKITANPTLFVGPAIALIYSGANRTIFSNQLTSNTVDLGQFITADTILTLKTLPLIVPTGVTNFTAYTQAVMRGGAVATISFGRIQVSSVLAPSTP